MLSIRRLSIPLVALAALACAGGEETPPVTTADSELAPGRHVFTTSDGTEMPYDVHGTGETTVVFVHCWMCERTFWEAQIPALEGRYRAIAVDLPGHGEAGDTRKSWTIAGFGEDVAGLLEQLDLRDVILVGHSMGGPVSLKAAALAQGRVSGVVAVDTLHDAEFDFDTPQVAQMVETFQLDFREACSGMVGFMFVEEGVEEIEERVRRIGCEESNMEAGKALMADFATVDMTTLFSEAGVPIRAINAAAPNPTQIETNRKYADFDAVLMEDVGHYLQMTRPEEFNRLLLETLESLSGAASSGEGV